ncbi:hypothetical protein Tco_1022116, partial [Tanacetum coccineum]
PCLDADFLVADSKYMKVAFGVGFKMLLFNPLVCSMKDLSRNLKLTMSNSSLGEDFPTGKDNDIVSAGRTKVIPAGLDDGVAASFQRSRIHKPHAHTQAFKSVALRNFDLEDIEFESTNSGTTAKLPILKLVTAKEKTNKKNDVKARSLLLMALPNEYLLTFSQYPDAKSMFAAIETRFRGNAATKKIQKTLLKQQYENFSALK